MNRAAVLFAVFVAIVGLLDCVSADTINCYSCTGTGSSSCGSSFTDTSSTVSCTSTLGCGTYKTTTDSVSTYTRGCGVSTYTSGCQSATVSGVTETVCYSSCTTNLCNSNSAGSITSSAVLLWSAAFMGLAALMKFEINV